MDMEREIEQLQQQHIGEIEQLQQQHIGEIEQLEQQHMGDIEQLEQQHATKTEQLEQQHATKTEQLERQHATRTKQLEQQHATKTEQLEKKHVAVLNKQVSRMRTEMERVRKEKGRIQQMYDKCVRQQQSKRKQFQKLCNVSRERYDTRPIIARRAREGVGTATAAAHGGRAATRVGACQDWRRRIDGWRPSWRRRRSKPSSSSWSSPRIWRPRAT